MIPALTVTIRRLNIIGWGFIIVIVIILEFQINIIIVNYSIRMIRVKPCQNMNIILRGLGLEDNSIFIRCPSGNEVDHQVSVGGPVVL